MTTLQGRPAILLDRDGTIIEDRGLLESADDIAFLPGVVEGLHLLQPHFGLVMITNQPWISRGQLTWPQLTAVNAAIISRLAKVGIGLLGWYACPHTREEGCSCIKPHPALGELAAAEHCLDLERSWTIGDHPHDVNFAGTLGARGGIYLLTGHGSHHLADLRGNASFIASDFMDAVCWLLRYTH
jgi:D-glycero-D-manno-heptose 1,7-bisphosphate phosphatase